MRPAPPWTLFIGDAKVGKSGGMLDGFLQLLDVLDLFGVDLSARPAEPLA